MPYPCGFIAISASVWVPEGVQVLRQKGESVYIGRIGDPIEDAIFDEVVLNPIDFEKQMNATSN